MSELDDVNDSPNTGGGFKGKIGYSGYTEAAWTIKVKKPYYGYKTHILPTGRAVDPYHGGFFRALVAKTVI